MTQKELKFYINGTFYPASQAKISVMDRSFLYGDAVMEGIPIWKGVPFKIDEHLKRLFEGMSVLMIGSPVTFQEAKKAILETVRVNSLQSGWLRPQITRGEGQFADKWNVLSAKANFVVLTGAYPPDYLKTTGEKAIVASIPRVPSSCIPSATKDCNYLNNILAAIERVRAGVGAAIMLDLEGNVVEGIAYNVFLVKGGVIFTPTTRNCLSGITRATIIELARKKGHRVTESDRMQVADLYLAEEVFVTSSGWLCQPLIEIDGRKVGDGKPGPITILLRRLLLEEMDRYADDFKG
ncbi:MAG: aminotransferase class IV [Chloroflexi bacterium]|nr:aminotransferase class IV [Chloroflexota bacterium]